MSFFVTQWVEGEQVAAGAVTLWPMIRMKKGFVTEKGKGICNKNSGILSVGVYSLLYTAYRRVRTYYNHRGFRNN